MSRRPLAMKEIDDRLSTLSGWVHEGHKIKKKFVFTDFAEAFAFMTQIAIKAEKIDHHPEWFNVYNRVNVELCTHDPQGISDLDFQLAKAMDMVLAK